MLDIKIEKATNLKAKTPDDQLGFGRIFTDHMFIMDYDAGQGWHDARIVPYGPISLDPSSGNKSPKLSLRSHARGVRCSVNR